jgi:DNA-binding transcriptional MerR regulator
MNDAVESPAPRKNGRKEIVKSATAFRTISEVANTLEIPQHVLRFWETKFNQVKPLKRGGGRRYYRPSDIDLIRAIRDLLYHDGYTIRGVQRLLRENGAKSLLQAATRGAENTADGADNAGIDTPEQPSPVDVPASPVASLPDTAQRSAGADIDKQSLRDILNELVDMRGVLDAAAAR